MSPIAFGYLLLNTISLLPQYLKVLKDFFVHMYVLQYCMDSDTSDKELFPTFARTRPPDTQISKSVAAVLKAFNWTQVRNNNITFVCNIGERHNLKVMHALFYDHVQSRSPGETWRLNYKCCDTIGTILLQLSFL